MVKILLVDIESAPALVYVWKFFQENVSPKQVVEHPFIMSIAAKWLDSDDIFYCCLLLYLKDIFDVMMPIF